MIKKCNTCGSSLKKSEQSFNILDLISLYIKEKLENFLIEEKCKFDDYFCSSCNSKLRQKQNRLKKQISDLDKNKKKNELQKNFKKEIKNDIEKISSKLKIKPSDVVRRKVKKHQIWFYNEFSGDHLRKKLKNIDYLKEEKEETRSLLGEATKFSLISKYKDKKFLVKYSKDSRERNNHGAKEIITEKIMTDIAYFFINSAKCSLVFYKNRLAISSTIFTYFGNKSKYNYRAIHGNEIFEYSFESPPQKRKEQKKFYELEKIESSVKDYPKKYEKLKESNSKNLLSQFRLMLLVDAFLGNQDRHHENWCLVLKSPKNNRNSNLYKSLYFSPLFDTGRGLFWNENIYELIYKYVDQKELSNYIEESSPLFHLKGKENINHFDVVKYIKREDPYLFKKFKKRLQEFPINGFLH